MKKKFMTHKISAVSALPDYRLSVRRAEGVTKIYDVKPLFDRILFSRSSGVRKSFPACRLTPADTGSSGMMSLICHAMSCGITASA